LLCNFKANATSSSSDDHYRLGVFVFFHRFNSMSERCLRAILQTY
jgi:hypothetical protein